MTCIRQIIRESLDTAALLNSRVGKKVIELMDKFYEYGIITSYEEEDRLTGKPDFNHIYQFKDRNSPFIDHLETVVSEIEDFTGLDEESIRKLVTYWCISNLKQKINV